MKVIIAGSRTLNKQSYVETAMSQAFNTWMSNDPENWRYYTRPEVVSGGAQGVDWQAEVYAKKHQLPFTEFPAKWKEFGKGAGFKRNAEMAEYADALVAVWNGTSNGTKHMITTMQKLGKPVYIYNVKDAT